MVNDDDCGGRGLSGWAGYMLGRMAAADDHRHAEFRNPKWYYDPGDVERAIVSWEAAVRGRDRTIANLKAQLSDTTAHNQTLRQYAADVYEENNRLREQLAKHEHGLNNMLRHQDEQVQAVSRLERDIAVLRNFITTPHQQHDEIFARIETEIARLNGFI